ncbi:MAG TPA: 4-hydroxy-3-methylbut-2-enyl diphosphate reductase [Propionibacterium sp.]|nr:4-hydroxy-3-methylbut-2-enyl diphosphate reductase [Propionibacterium sp.]
METEAETSAYRSRNVSQCHWLFCRRFSSISCPSTHTRPSRSTQPLTAVTIFPSGCGASAEDSMATNATIEGRYDSLGSASHTPRLWAMGDKRVVVAAPRGYCAGVDRAVVSVEKALEHYGAPVYVRKQIVHNKHVVETLTERGAIFVEELDEVPEGAITVFSAHGVSPMVHADAKQRRLQTIDATCPLVTKVHKEAKRFAEDDLTILLIGHEGHEEVEGTAGEAPDRTILVQSPADAETVEVPDPDRVAWLSQTTLSVDETMQIVRRLKERFPNIIDPPSDDICYATTNRQAAVKQIAEHSDLVIVVGSTNSSNSVRLVEVALDAGAKAAYLVDYANEIDPAWLEGVTSIGVTSGASVPEVLVQGVLERLAEHGFGDVAEERLTEENLTFALPPELRKTVGRSSAKR